MCHVECDNKVGYAVDRGFQNHFIRRIKSSGRHENREVTGTPTAASASRISSTLSRVAPTFLRCSNRLSTASYSNINGTESKSSKRLPKAKMRSCLEAPLLLRKAATITSVSKTLHTGKLDYILQAIKGIARELYSR
jgi:hypothetical protein